MPKRSATTQSKTRKKRRAFPHRIGHNRRRRAESTTAAAERKNVNSRAWSAAQPPVMMRQRDLSRVSGDTVPRGSPCRTASQPRNQNRARDEDAFPPGIAHNRRRAASTTAAAERQNVNSRR